MGKMDKDILVVRRDLLFPEGHFEGFIHSHEGDYLSRINDNYTFLRRGDVEVNPEFQQPIPYVWIVNPDNKQIFAYKRSSGENYAENRLAGKWSCGVGGHIDRDSEGNSLDPLGDAMIREFEEEVCAESYSPPKILGYVNIEKTPVDRVHFGVVAIVEARGVSKGDDEMDCGRFYGVSELEDIFSNSDVTVEQWTHATWPVVRDYINAL